MFHGELAIFTSFHEVEEVLEANNSQKRRQPVGDAQALILFEASKRFFFVVVVAILDEFVSCLS